MLVCRPHRQRSRARNGWRRRRGHPCQGSNRWSASSSRQGRKECQSEFTEDQAKLLLDDKKRLLDEHNSVPDADKRVLDEKNTEIVLAGNRTVSAENKTETVSARTKPVLAGNKTVNKTVSAESKTENVSEEHKRGAEQAYGSPCSRIPRVLSWILSVCTNTCGPCRHRRRSARDSGSSR